MARKTESELNVEKLGQMLGSRSVYAFTANGQWKCTFDFADFLLQILYEITDGFYRVKIERKHEDLFETTLFLTKSKHFHREVKHLLKREKLCKKSFSNHVTIVLRLLKDDLNAQGLANMKKQYLPDLRFDGIFM